MFKYERFELRFLAKLLHQVVFRILLFAGQARSSRVTSSENKNRTTAQSSLVNQRVGVHQNKSRTSADGFERHNVYVLVQHHGAALS
jgi:hypothetical protein